MRVVDVTYSRGRRTFSKLLPRGGNKLANV